MQNERDIMDKAEQGFWLGIASLAAGITSLFAYWWLAVAGFVLGIMARGKVKEALASGVPKDDLKKAYITSMAGYIVGIVVFVLFAGIFLADVFFLVMVMPV